MPGSREAARVSEGGYGLWSQVGRTRAQLPGVVNMGQHPDWGHWLLVCKLKTLIEPPSYSFVGNYTDASEIMYTKCSEPCPAHDKLNTYIKNLTPKCISTKEYIWKRPGSAKRMREGSSRMKAPQRRGSPVLLADLSPEPLTLPGT